MKRRNKIKLQELIDYWNKRAELLKGKEPTPLSITGDAAAKAYKHCAGQLQKILDGKPTEAKGFKLPGKKINPDILPLDLDTTAPGPDCPECSHPLHWQDTQCPNCKAIWSS